MSSGHREIERKFDVGVDVAVPDLSDLPGVTSVSDPEAHDLAATYYDTADLRLLRAKVTLRRRTGGTDAGWHVKLPEATGARRELHQPLGRAVKAVPARVLEPVLGIVGTQAAVPVATVQTHRVVRRLLDGNGRVLAEVADDTVTGAALAPCTGEPATVSAWRELEVELVGGDEVLLDVVGRRLIDAGAKPSASASKVGQVVAGRLSAMDGGPPARPGGRTRPGHRGRPGKHRRPTAGELVLAAVAERVGDLHAADLAVRTGQGDGVHDFRVACRRLRTVFAAFRSVLRREQTDPLRTELRWVARELSGARDGEVALEHLRLLVADQPAELVLGPVAARLQQAKVRDSVLGDTRVAQVLSDRRYLRLVDGLADLIAEPSLTALADAPARPVAARAVRSSTRRLRRTVRAAEQAVGPARHAQVHEVRKAAKRARYTAEVAAPVLGRRVRGLRRSAKKVQQILGRMQDTVVTREYCTRLGREAVSARENPWTYGRLHALEQGRAEQAEAVFWARWPRVSAAVEAVAR